MVRRTVSAHRSGQASLLVAICCVCLPSCLHATDPLADFHKARIDRSVLGTWRTQDDAGLTTWFHVGVPEEADFPSGFLKILIVNTGPEGGLDAYEAAFFTTAHEGRSYANFVARPKKPFNPASVLFWGIAKYRVRGDELTIWLPDSDLALKEIEAGHVRGNSSGQLTDSPANRLRWLAAQDAKLFVRPTVAYRVPDRQLPARAD